jgi:hypothetical protein
MRVVTCLSILGLLVAMPSALRAQEAGEAYNHGSAGIFVDYFRFTPGSGTTNFVGFGGRGGFNVSHNVQIEGEFNWDFERNYTNTFSNNLTTSFVTTRVRPLTGLFGPKFETHGPFKFFITGKVGFVNFSTSASAVTFGELGTSFSAVGSSGTHFALYPGGGVEGFWGPFGLRAEIGDEVYFRNGAYNNLRLTFGPQLRF